MNDKLDFLIIGAQKSATTALFRYLQSHPTIEMPAVKEAPLFTNDVTSSDADNFMKTHFTSSNNSIKGKATPQYMCDEKVPARIMAHNPAIKLIAVLREPIDRAWSQYRMNLRRETEQRSFDQAVVDLLQTDNLIKARSGSAPTHDECYESESEYYLAWSEYGRILNKYTEFFNHEQLLVIYTDELACDPAAALDKVLTFLDLEPGYRPKNLGEKIHQGGNASIISSQLKSRILSFPPINLVWGIIPEKHKQLVRYWYEQKNVKKSIELPLLDATNRKLLESHFRKDAELIKIATGKNPEWI